MPEGGKEGEKREAGYHKRVASLSEIYFCDFHWMLCFKIKDHSLYTKLEPVKNRRGEHSEIPVFNKVLVLTEFSKSLQGPAK